MKRKVPAYSFEKTSFPLLRRDKGVARVFSTVDVIPIYLKNITTVGASRMLVIPRKEASEEFSSERVNLILHLVS